MGVSTNAGGACSCCLYSNSKGSFLGLIELAVRDLTKVKWVPEGAGSGLKTKDIQCSANSAS